MRITELELREAIRRVILEVADFSQSPWDWYIKPLEISDLKFWADKLGLLDDHPLHPDTAEIRMETSNFYCPIEKKMKPFEKLIIKVSAREHGMYQMDDKIARDRIGLYIAVDDWKNGKEGVWGANIQIDAAYDGGTLALEEPDDLRHPSNEAAFADLFDNWLGYAQGHSRGGW
jgi:hypothetical protein